ncbi:winged helix-turn-helix domain-containing protein [Bradyrhizobium sp. WSM2254]|uniref:ATP-binding protein n=1 Tax=Bradyrhizobium sp. WSM2254 TaxID=1188263 RepID=UPI000A036082|nr:winged helix-turn-helix domain-containing protein [Bradyrhizobium sp. WSM2254]
MQSAIPTNGPRTQEVVSFGPFRLFPSERVLKRADETVKLGSRAFDILLALVQNAGEVVGQRELIAKVWPGIFVEEVTLRVHLTALRKALDIGEGGERYLTNVPGRGYCFVAPTSREMVGLPTADEFPEGHYPLPPALGQIVGRDEIVSEICHKLTSERFVTVVGPGGLGKTTVALSVARTLLPEFFGAVCFVELSPVADPRLLAPAVVSAFGLPVQSGDPIPGLVGHLHGKPILLILDGSEHLVAEAAALSERLFAALPQLHLLVTSREVLRVGDENVYRLSPLETPPDSASLTAAELLGFPAVKLFVQRATTSGGQINLAEHDVRIAGNICRKLGGNALAIELAAGRVGAYGLQEIARLLDSEFALRWPGRRTAPPRHQTLGATLDWSYNLLSEVERTVLRRLSVFVTGFTHEAAQQVAGGPGIGAEEVFDAVGGLLMKSLASADTTGSVARYRLLDTTRTYAALKLADAGELDQFRRAHAQYYCALLKRANEADLPTDERRALVTHLDDIRAALHWAFGNCGDPSIGVDLTSHASSIWLSKALFAECRDWTIRAAAVAPNREDGKATDQQIVIHLALASSQLFTTSFSVEAMVAWTRTLENTVRETQGKLILRYLASWGGSIRTRYDEALELAQRCAEDAKKLSDPGPTALAEWMLGHSLHHLGRLAESRAHLERSLAVDTEKARLAQVNAIGYDRRVDTLGNLASTLWLQGFPEQAESTGACMLEAARPLQFAMPLSVAMTWASFHGYLSGTDIDAVEHDIVELIEHARTHLIKPQVGIGNCLLALCQTKRNQFDAAMPLASEGLRQLAEMQYEVFVPLILAHLSESAIAAGRRADAVSLMAQLAGRDLNREHWCTAEVLRVKGLLALLDNRADAAAALFLQSAALARKQGALAWELRTAMNLARLRANQGNPDEAKKLLEEVYDRFTEGFETVDLLAARSLLRELAR